MLNPLRPCAPGIAMATVLVAAGSSAIAAPSQPSTGVVGTRVVVRCGFAEIDKVVMKALTRSGGKAWLSARNVKCSGSWAVAFPDVGPSRAHANTVTLVLKWNGNAWLLKSRGGTTCKSPGHDVPAPLFRLACQSN